MRQILHSFIYRAPPSTNEWFVVLLIHSHPVRIIRFTKTGTERKNCSAFSQFLIRRKSVATFVVRTCRRFERWDPRISTYPGFRFLFPFCPFPYFSRFRLIIVDSVNHRSRWQFFWKLSVEIFEIEEIDRHIWERRLVRGCVHLFFNSTSINGDRSSRNIFVDLK